MSKQMTHTGFVAGRGLAKSGTVTLRKTAKFWVDSRGFKFRVLDGTETGTGWSTYSTLRLSSILLIKQPA